MDTVKIIIIMEALSLKIIPTIINAIINRIFNKTAYKIFLLLLTISVLSFK